MDVLHPSMCSMFSVVTHLQLLYVCLLLGVLYSDQTSSSRRPSSLRLGKWEPRQADITQFQGIQECRDVKSIDPYCLCCLRKDAKSAINGSLLKPSSVDRYSSSVRGNELNWSLAKPKSRVRD